MFPTKPRPVGLLRGIANFPLRNLGLLACFFALLKPSLFDLNSQVTLACRAFAVLVLAWLVYAYVRDRRRLSLPLVLFVAFRLSMLIPTLLNEGDLLNWGYATVSQVALFLLIEREMHAGRRSALHCLGVLRFLLLTYLVVNCVMVLLDVGTVKRLMTDGEVTTWYLLGIRTRVTDCLFPALMVSLTIDAAKGERLSICTAATLVVGLIQVLYLEVATAAFGLLVLAAGLVAMGGSRFVRDRLSVRNILLLGLLATLLVVGLRVQEGFADLLGSFFDKNMTLTGRTDIWDIAFGIIAQSPVFGYGINDSVGAFVLWRGMYWQSHNQWVQLLYDGGIVAAALFAALLLACGSGIDRRGAEGRVFVPAKATLLAFMMMMVSEIYTYNMGLFFLVPFVMAGLPSLIEGGPALGASGSGEGAGQTFDREVRAS